MVDQDVISFSRGQHDGKETTLKDDQNRGNAINETPIGHGTEQTLKKIWIYSSARKFGGSQMKRDGSKFPSAPASVSRNDKRLEMQLNTSLSGSPLSQKGQAKLDALLNHKIHPTRIIGKSKRVGDGPHAGEKRKKARGPLPSNGNGSKTSESRPVIKWQISDDSLRESVRKMASDIMKYELQLASLHGTMTELQRENERLRSDRALCERLAEKLVEKTEKNPQAKTPESGQKPSILLEVEKSYDEKTSVTGRDETVEAIDLKSEPSLEHQKVACEKLKRLESRILGRLEEYKRLTVDAEIDHSSTVQSRKDIQKESPFVAELKLKLLKLHQELAQLRSWTNVRLLNMRNNIQKEQLLRQRLGQDMAGTQELADTWKAYAEQYKAQVKIQEDALFRMRSNQKQVDRFIYRLKNDYDELLAAHRRLTHRAHTGGNDSESLNADLENERLKNRMLEAMVQSQRNEVNHLASMVQRGSIQNSPLQRTAHQDGSIVPSTRPPLSTSIVGNTRSAPSRPGYEPLSHIIVEDKNVILMNDTSSVAAIIKQESPAPHGFETEEPRVSLESPDTTVAFGTEP